MVHMLNLARPTRLLVFQSVWTSRPFTMTRSAAVVSNVAQSKPKSIKPSSSSPSTSTSFPLGQSYRGSRTQRSGQDCPLPTTMYAETNSGNNYKKPQARSSDNRINSSNQFDNQRDQRRDEIVDSKSSGTKSAIFTETQKVRDSAPITQNEAIPKENDHQVSRGKRHNKRSTKHKYPLSSTEEDLPNEPSVALEKLLVDMSKQVIRPVPRARIQTTSFQPRASLYKTEIKPDGQNKMKQNKTSASSDARQTTPNRSDHCNRPARPASNDPLPTNNDHREPNQKDLSPQNRSSNHTQRHSICHGESTPQNFLWESSSSGRYSPARSPVSMKSFTSNVPQDNQMRSESDIDPSQNLDFIPTRSPYVKIVYQRNPGHSAISKQFSINDIPVCAIWTLPPTPPSLSHPEGQQSFHVTVKDPYDLGRALKMKSSNFRIISAHLEDDI